MSSIRDMLLGTAILAIVAITIIGTFSLATSQTAGSWSPAIAALRQAESAGATPSEVRDLVVLLNGALSRQNEALKLNMPDQASERATLLAQADVIISNVQTRATNLTVIASQRTSANKIFTYGAGVVVAILGTIVLAFAGSLYQKYRIERTFQMRVSRK